MTKSGSLDGEKEGKYNDVDVVEISEMILMHDDCFLWVDTIQQSTFRESMYISFPT